MTPLTAALLLALAGAAVGSFIGLVSLRLPKGEAIALGRSRCSRCARPLGPADLVPLLSFVGSRGRCRSCGGAIQRRYPLLEAACLTIGLVSALVLPLDRALLAALLAWWLLLLALLDVEHYWLPDRLTYPLIAIGLAAVSWLEPQRLPHHLIGAGAGFLLLQGIAAAYGKLRGRIGLGGGDAKLFAAAGAWLGWEQLPLVLLGASGTALVAALILHHQSADFLAQRLPFGAFLAPAIWILYLLG